MPCRSMNSTVAPVTRGEWQADAPQCSVCYFRYGKEIAREISLLVFTYVDDAIRNVYRQKSIKVLEACLKEERVHMNRKTLTRIIEARIYELQEMNVKEAA